MGILMYLALPYLLIAAGFLLMTQQEQRDVSADWDRDASTPRPLALRCLSMLLCLFWPVAIVAVCAALVLAPVMGLFPQKLHRQTAPHRPAPASVG